MGKKSQVWIETVIYTLIGLAIIALILSIAKPAIDKKKDEIILKDSQKMLETINEGIEYIIFRGPGNSWPIDIKIGKGKLEMDSKNDEITFSMESTYQYSELNQNIVSGDIIIQTIQKGSIYDVSLKLNYTNKLNLTWNNQESFKTFNPAPSNHEIVMINKGRQGSLTHIDFS